MWPLWAACLGGIVTGLLRTNVVFACLLGLVMGLAGAAPFFLLFRQFFLKMLCGAAGTGRRFPPLPRPG